MADITVANLRTAAGQDRHDKALQGLVGDLALAYETMDLRSEPGPSLTIYTAEPGSPSAQALALLASWAATQGAAPVRSG